MALTAAWCHWVVLQHTEQEDYKMDQMENLGQARGIEPESTGRSSRGLGLVEVEEDKQTDKRVNETLVHHRVRPGKAAGK